MRRLGAQDRFDGYVVHVHCASAPSAGPGSATVTIKRDVTAPTVTCDPTPTFDYTQQPRVVTATVTGRDVGRGDPDPPALVGTTTIGPGTATLTGLDRAGNSFTRTCAYVVRAPTCLGNAVTIRGTAGADVLNGTAGVDVIHGFGGADRIQGLAGNDIICGGPHPDIVTGGPGADRINGGAGDDDLSGGDGDDDLSGGEDSDSIRGDNGIDRCSSGEIRMSSCAVIY